ncbi:pleckstrin homology domain-containing family A member 7-like, partial [Neolamprologus brichardi]|uniref:pleckstrin homology domain-containing family A member 7-like n=1 Tax=Neolamprologus brichardi TaxID=32507 RepID=UPI0016437B4C
RRFPRSSSSTPTTQETPGHLDDTLESSSILAPERDRPSPSPSPCPTPPPSPPRSPPPSPPPVPVLTPHLPLPAVRKAVEDGEGTTEERAHGSQASADSFCRVMDLLGMGHRLFVPRLLATSKEDLLQADFEGALKFFRVQLPKRYRAAENARRLMEQACNIKQAGVKMMQEVSIMVAYDAHVVDRPGEEDALACLVAHSRPRRAPRPV